MSGSLTDLIQHGGSVSVSVTRDVTKGVTMRGCVIVHVAAVRDGLEYHGHQVMPLSNLRQLQMDPDVALLDVISLAMKGCVLAAKPPDFVLTAAGIVKMK